MENLYEVIGVLPTASALEIKEAYSRASARLISSGLPEAEISTRLAGLDQAFALLGDPGTRTEYDHVLSAQASPTSASALTLLERPATIMRPEAPQTPLIQQPCPYCGAPNPLQASVCAGCGNQISRPCPSCGQAVLLSQPVCPRCATFLPEYDQRRAAQALIAEQKIQADRRASEANTQALEEGHRLRASQGLVFWLVVAIACMILASIPFVVYTLVMNRP